MEELQKKKKKAHLYRCACQKKKSTIPTFKGGGKSVDQGTAIKKSKGCGAWWELSGRALTKTELVTGQIESR